MVSNANFCGFQLSRSLTPQLPHPLPQAPSQERPQRAAVCITHPLGDTLHAIVGRPQQMRRPLDAQILNIRDRGLADRIAHATRQRALARRQRCRGSVQRQRLIEMVADSM